MPRQLKVPALFPGDEYAIEVSDFSRYVVSLENRHVSLRSADLVDAHSRAVCQVPHPLSLVLSGRPQPFLLRGSLEGVVCDGGEGEIIQTHDVVGYFEESFGWGVGGWIVSPHIFSRYKESFCYIIMYFDRQWDKNLS